MEQGIDRETLRAELGQLELRLVDRLATALEAKADSKVVEQHDARISSLELSRAARETLPVDLSDQDKRITSLERFRYAFPSVAVLAFLAAAANTIFWFVHG